MNRERVGDAAAIAVRRNHDDVAEFAQRLRERGNARALNAVVVGDENAQLMLPNASAVP
jgi:hypothetical protein